jgi:hypothetical protein
MLYAEKQTRTDYEITAICSLLFLWKTDSFEKKLRPDEELARILDYKRQELNKLFSG